MGKPVKRLLVIVAAWVVVLLSASNAHACLAVRVFANNLAFGPYNPLAGSPVASSFNIRVECVSVIDLGTFPFAFQVGINSLINPGSGVRTMRHTLPTYSLDYEIYSDPGYSTVWGGVGTGAGSEVPGVFPSFSASQPITFTGFGLIAGGQNVPSGIYGDSMIVTVTF